MKLRPRLPLYGKILLWFLVNLAVIAALGFSFMHAQFGLRLDWMLAGPGGERFEQLGESLAATLRDTPESQWPAVLSKYEATHGLTFTLFGSDGLQRLGPSVQVPGDVRARLIDKRGPGDMPPPPPPPPVDRRGPPRERRSPPPDAPPKPRFMLRAGTPAMYWAGIHLSLSQGEGDARRPLTLLIVSDSLTGRGLFFNPWPWAGLAAGGLLLSALIWLPVVGGITRSIRRLNEASKRIAAGCFDVRLPEARHDELGELAASVNTMAAQLGDYVSQQRRITRDVAHELCSPIARMQMALGVIEQRGTPEQAAYLRKLDTELQHMARLVEEVMAFSKAESIPEREAPEDFSLLELTRSVIAREAPDAAVEVDVPAGLQVHTLKSAVDRALGNVIRNAVRYASHAGPIGVWVRQQPNQTVIHVADQGPGVPAEALPRLFDPFYRPESARARHTGGTGLGLAIARHCIEACRGAITAQSREPTGLEVQLVIPS